MIEVRNGSIFESECQVLVNSVNCCGVMGAGIALEFKQRFPTMFRAYKKACRDGEINIGRPMLWKSADKWILNFSSKLHYVQSARLEYIEAGLSWIAANYRDEEITSIAVPQLGTALGGLPWPEVRQLMYRYLEPLHDLRVEIYERPQQADERPIRRVPTRA